MFFSFLFLSDMRKGEDCERNRDPDHTEKGNKSPHERRQKKI